MSWHALNSVYSALWDMHQQDLHAQADACAGCKQPIVFRRAAAEAAAAVMFASGTSLWTLAQERETLTGANLPKKQADIREQLDQRMRLGPSNCIVWHNFQKISTGGLCCSH